MLKISKDNQQINALTGLRAIAAFFVVIHHLYPKQKGILNSILEELNIGVTVFFVLSGFLIALRYSDSVQLNRKWLKKYFVNRVARIFPMFFILTSLASVFDYLSNPNFSISNTYIYILNILLLKGFFANYVYSIIPQTWTLTVEECFYFSAPLVFVLNKKINILVQSVIIFSIGFLLYIFFRNIDFFGFFNSLPHILITTFFGRVFEFLIGVFCFYNINKFSKIKYKTNLGIIFFILFFLFQIVINYYNSKFAIQTTIGYLVNEFLFPIAISLFILGLVYESTYISKWLETKLMVLLGKSSYTLYLFHWGYSSYLINRFISTNFFVTLFMTYIGSILLWHFIEEPANKIIRKSIKY